MVARRREAAETREAGPTVGSCEQPDGTPPLAPPRRRGEHRGVPARPNYLDSTRVDIILEQVGDDISGDAKYCGK